MKYRNICIRHPNRFVVVCPAKRKKGTNFVSSWKVLNVQYSLEKAEELQKFYKNEGLSGVVIIDTGNREDNNLPPAKVAEFLRVYFGTEQDEPIL